MTIARIVLLLVILVLAGVCASTLKCPPPPTVRCPECGGNPDFTDFPELRCAECPAIEEIRCPPCDDEIRAQIFDERHGDDDDDYSSSKKAKTALRLAIALIVFNSILLAIVIVWLVIRACAHLDPQSKPSLLAPTIVPGVTIQSHLDTGFPSIYK